MRLRSHYFGSRKCHCPMFCPSNSTWKIAFFIIYPNSQLASFLWYIPLEREEGRDSAIRRWSLFSVAQMLTPHFLSIQSRRSTLDWDLSPQTCISALPPDVLWQAFNCWAAVDGNVSLLWEQHSTGCQVQFMLQQCQPLQSRHLSSHGTQWVKKPGLFKWPKHTWGK